MFAHFNLASSLRLCALCELSVKKGTLPVLHLAPPSNHTIPNSFRITSFADHHPLTLIESHLYTKQGRGDIQSRFSRLFSASRHNFFILKGIQHVETS